MFENKQHLGGEFCGKEFESSKSKCGSIHEEEG